MTQRLRKAIDPHIPLSSRHPFRDFVCVLLYRYGNR